MRYLYCLFLCLIAELSALPASLVVPLLERAYPGKFSLWWLTPDNPIDGDSGHLERTKGWHWYPRQVWWLLRNRAYGFKLYVIGCPAPNKMRVYGNPYIKNRSNAVSGWLFLKAPDGWYFKFVLPIGFSYCLQWAFGWQLDSRIDGRCLFMFSPRLPTRFYPK